LLATDVGIVGFILPLFPACFFFLVGYQSLYSKKIIAFFEYMKDIDEKALIDEIGT